MLLNVLLCFVENDEEKSRSLSHLSLLFVPLSISSFIISFQHSNCAFYAHHQSKWLKFPCSFSMACIDVLIFKQVFCRWYITIHSTAIFLQRPLAYPRQVTHIDLPIVLPILFRSHPSYTLAVCLLSPRGLW